MEWRRVKNLMILTLLVVNAALLILVLVRRGESLRYERSALERTLGVLAAQDITLTEREIHAGKGVQPAAAERSISAESAAMSALLGGAAEGENLGGGLFLYRTALGEVSVRGGGELSGSFTADERWKSSDPAALAQKLLGEMKLSAQLVSDENGRAVFRQTLGGNPVFSCVVSFTYEDGALTGVSGNLLMVDTVQEEQAQLLSLPTVLMRFLEDVNRNGDVCSAILSVEAGQRSVQSFTGGVHLSPVWAISTNTMDYLVDGITGEVSRSARG